MGGMGSGEFVRDEGVKRWIYGVWIILLLISVCIRLDFMVVEQKEVKKYL